MAEERLPAEIHYPDGRIEHPHVRFETTDANSRWVLTLLLITTALGIAVLFGVLALTHKFASYEASIKESPFPLSKTPVHGVPPEPRLEQIERVQKAQKNSREEQERLLHSYGPTPDKGYVHIPIERAMEVLASKLAARQAVKDGARRDNGLVDAGESNSGRMFRKGPR
jgi:hypothetical protein